MKSLYHFLSLLFIVALCTLPVKAQYAEISSNTVHHVDEIRDSWSALVDAPADDLKKAWKKHLDDHHQVDVKGVGLFSNKDILTAEDAQISSLSNQAVHLYAKVVEKGAGSEISVFAVPTTGQSWNHKDHRQESEALKEMLEQFLESYLVEYHQEELDQARKNLSKLQDDEQDLKEKVQKNKDDIRKMEQEITELKRENEDHVREIEQLESDIKTAEKVVETYNQKYNDVKARFSIIE